MDGKRALRTLLLIVGLSPVPAANAQVVNVDLGRLVLAVSDAPTAQVFHIVDQLSEWDQYAHKQYVRWAAKALNLTQEDRRLLQQHAELRRARGWGKGFEQAFLIADSIDTAATKAAASGVLSAGEATTERRIAAVLRPLLRASLEQGETLAAFLLKAANKWRAVSPR